MLDLNEAKETAEHLIEWYIEGYDENGPDLPAFKKDVEMLEFYVKLSNKLTKRIEALSRINMYADFTTKELIEILEDLSK